MYNSVYKLSVNNIFNIITVPKQGCTQIGIIVSDVNGYFDDHKHSFTNNVCVKHSNIHNCMSINSSFDPTLNTYMFTRKIEDKILSYYLANYRYMRTQNSFPKSFNKNESFYGFVKNIDKYAKYDSPHIGLMNNSIRNIDITFLDLDNFFTEFQRLLDEYKINYTIKNNNISNESKNLYKNGNQSTTEPFNLRYDDIKNYNITSGDFFNDEIINILRDYYKNDEKFYL